MSKDFSLIVPTYNERDNIEALIKDTHQAMEGSDLAYELIIVDDNSPDGTADIARSFSSVYPVVVHQRAGKLGLATAVLEGWERAQGRVLGVMDADGSHDVRILPPMVSTVIEGTADLAVGSRYIPGGGLGNWPLKREIISRVAVLMAKPICPVADLTSGFFVCHRDVVDQVHLNPTGFKIGLEVMIKGNYRNFVEFPYTFQDRHQGASKLGSKEVGAYLGQLAKLFVHWLKTRPTRNRIDWRSLPNQHQPTLGRR